MDITIVDVDSGATLLRSTSRDGFPNYSNTAVFAINEVWYLKLSEEGSAASGHTEIRCIRTDRIVEMMLHLKGVQY